MIRYLLVQPYATGPQRFHRASIVGEFTTAQDAFAQLDRYLARLAEQGIRDDALQFYVVDVHRKPVARPRTDRRHDRGAPRGATRPPRLSSGRRRARRR